MAKLTPCRARGAGAGGWGLAVVRSRRRVQASGRVPVGEDVGRDEAAASDLAGNEAFRFEEFVGGGDGGAVETK